MSVDKVNITDRERVLTELRRHLGIPETGGEASLSVVIDGVKLEVSLRATRLQSSVELAGLRAQLDAVLAAKPWQIGEGTCGAQTSRKISAWSKRNAQCSKPISGAVLYRAPEWDFAAKKAIDKVVAVGFFCPHHDDHGVEAFRIIGVLPLSKFDVARYRKQRDAYEAAAEERRRLETLTRPVTR